MQEASTVPGADTSDAALGRWVRDLGMVPPKKLRSRRRNDNGPYYRKNKIIKHIVVIFSFYILLNQLQTLKFFYYKKSLHELFCALFEHLLPDKKMTFPLKVIHVRKNFSAASMENDSNRYLLNYTSVSSIKLINKMITITAVNKIQHIN